MIGLSRQGKWYRECSGMLSPPWMLRKDHSTNPIKWAQRVEHQILPSPHTSLEQTTPQTHIDKTQISQQPMVNPSKSKTNESTTNRFKPYTINDIPITRKNKQSKNKTKKRTTRPYAKDIPDLQSSNSSDTGDSSDDSSSNIRRNSKSNEKGHETTII